MKRVHLSRNCHFLHRDLNMVTYRGGQKHREKSDTVCFDDALNLLFLAMKLSNALYEGVLTERLQSVKEI